MTTTVTKSTKAAPTTERSGGCLLPQRITSYDNQGPCKYLLIGDDSGVDQNAQLIGSDGLLSNVMGPEGLYIKRGCAAPINDGYGFFAYPQDSNTDEVYARAYKYNWQSGEFTRLADPGLTVDSVAPVAINFGNGKILVVTSTVPGTWNHAAALYDIVGNAWSAAATPIADGFPIFKGLLLSDGNVMVLSQAGAQVYDPALDSWSATINSPTLVAGLLINLHSGKAAWGGADTLAYYDPGTNTWTEQAAPPFNSAYWAVEYVPGVLMVGSDLGTYVFDGTTWTAGSDTSNLLYGGWLAANSFFGANFTTALGPLALHTFSVAAGVETADNGYPVWPAGLPSPLGEDGAGYEPADNTIKSQTEVGPPKVRRRFTGKYEKFSFSLILSPEMRTTLITFIDQTLNEVGRFNWIDQRTGGLTVYRFFGLPKETYVADGWWRADIVLEKLK